MTYTVLSGTLNSTIPYHTCPYVIYYPTVTVRYSLFVLKVPLNPKQTNKQTNTVCTIADTEMRLNVQLVDVLGLYLYAVHSF